MFNALLYSNKLRDLVTLVNRQLPIAFCSNDMRFIELFEDGGQSFTNKGLEISRGMTWPKEYFKELVRHPGTSGTSRCTPLLGRKLCFIIKKMPDKVGFSLVVVCIGNGSLNSLCVPLLVTVPPDGYPG